MAGEGPRTCGSASVAIVDRARVYSAVRVTFRPQDASAMTLQTGDVMTKSVMCRGCGLTGGTAPGSR